MKNNIKIGCSATIKVKKNPRTVLEHGSGISFFVYMELLSLFLLNGIKAYANVNCKIHHFFIKQKLIEICPSNAMHKVM